MKHRTGEGGGGGESPLVMGLIRAYTYRSLNYLVSTITFENYHVFSAPYVYVHACTCIWDSFHKNGPSHIIHDCIKCYKNSLCLNHYNFRMINAIDFLFSTLHTFGGPCT